MKDLLFKETETLLETIKISKKSHIFTEFSELIFTGMINELEIIGRKGLTDEEYESFFVKICELRNENDDFMPF